MVGVILAAGDGARLKASTGKPVCKVLEQISGTYLIAYALNNLVALNIERAFIVVGREGDAIKNAIGNRYQTVNVTYIEQSNPNGLMGALLQALPMVGQEDMLLQLADEVFVDLKTESIKELIAQPNADFHCGITYEADPDKIKHNFSVAVEGAKLQSCTEKPTTVLNDIKGTGFCLFTNQTLQLLKQMPQVSDLCDFMNALLDNGQTGTIFQVAEREFNINTLSDLEEAKLFFETK